MKLWTGIVEEALDLTNAYQSKSSSRVKEGHLWQTLPEILYSMPIYIGTSWKKFHALKQFNWIIKETMPGGWVPICTCGRDCIPYGKRKPPRLVSAEQDNYVLNDPESFFCKFCSKTAKDKKYLGVPKNERAQYSYLSTCNHILEQLCTKNIDIFLMFPCTLKERAAIDNELLDSMMHNATEGTGLAAQEKKLKQKHCEQCQEKERKWAAWIKNCKIQPHFLMILLFYPSVDSSLFIC